VEFGTRFRIGRRAALAFLLLLTLAAGVVRFRAIDRGLGILVGSRPTFATHQLDGISDVDTLLRWLTARK